jgi:hypothetical protein
MIGFGSGNDVRYQERDGYSFIAMENGDAKRLLETAQHLTGIPLLVTYECLRNSLIKYGMIKTDRDSWKSFSGLPATNRGIVSEQTPDSKYADAAIAILDCPEWLSIVSRVERSFFDNVAAMMEFSREDDDGSDGWRSGRRNSALSLRLYLTGELLLLESRVDYDGISVALTKLKTLFQNKNQNISTNIYSMDVLADFLLQTTPSSQSEKRMRAIELAVSRSLNHFSMLTHGYQKTALETILPHLSASEVIYAMRIFNKKSERQIYSSRPEGRFRLDYDLAQRVAEGLSVEEFWQMTMDDNIEVRMAAYQVASHFIGKRTDVDGNVASVKDLVRIMISGGAVGDKELNAHIAKLCDLGADLSTVAAASSIYKMLDMGTDFDSFDDDALLVAASEFSGLSGIANHSLKKAMIERCKNDKDFLKKVKGVNPRLASEIGSIQGGVAHSEAAQFIKDIIFSKRSHILDYVRGLDQAILDYYVKNILSLIPRSKWSGFFFTSLGKDCQHIIDAVRGVSDLRDDTTPDISGRVRTKEDKREFILNSLAQALQTGRIESTPAGIHNEISQLNKKLRQQNTPLFDVVNPHPAYTSRFAEGVEFVQNDGEQDVTYVAKIISNSHDKLEWGDELNFCLGNESYTNKARTGRYFYIGVYATLKDGRPKKYGVVEIASNWAVLTRQKDPWPCP